MRTGKQGNHSYTLTISNSGVTTTSLPSGIKGLAYNATLTATGGVAPYSWTIAPGQPGKIPSGLSMSSSGAISGTPGTLGYQEFTVRATDSKRSAFLADVGHQHGDAIDRVGICSACGNDRTILQIVTGSIGRTGALHMESGSRDAPIHHWS